MPETIPRPADFNQGPYLAAAFLCERVLVEQDGVKSAIRIVDRVTQTAVGPNPPEAMEPFNHELTLVVSFKKGHAQGSKLLKISLMNPRGDTRSIMQQTIFFDGQEDRGVDTIGQMQMRLEVEGLYWFEVSLDERFITRIPMRVIYLRRFLTPPQIQGPGSQPGQGPATAP